MKHTVYALPDTRVGAGSINLFGQEQNMLKNNTRRFFVAAVVIVAATVFAAPSWSQVKVPSTPEEHFARPPTLMSASGRFARSAVRRRQKAFEVFAGTDRTFALAKKYKEKADGYRKEAAEHREMADAYRKSAINAHEAHGQKNPWVTKMENHCKVIATKADALAVENDKAADYHTLRGKELQGK